MTAAIKRDSLRALVHAADIRLPAGPKLALIALARLHDDRYGHSQGANKTIAILCGCSESQARRHLDNLAALGLITRIPCSGKANLYHINFDALAQRAQTDHCRPTAPHPYHP